MGNRIAYFEIGASDYQSLVRFYQELFGWRMQEASDGYVLVDTQAGSGIGGAIGRSRTGEPWVSFYVAVEDPQAALERAEALGGATAVPVVEVPGVVTFAMLNDPDGNLVGVVKAGGMAPGPSAGDGVAVDWFEVLGADAERTQRFYRDLFGWTLTSSGSPAYGLVDPQAGEGAIGGGLGAGEGATWATVYANVPDVAAVLAGAEALGGGRVYGPNQVDDHMRTGALRDPAGNVFGVYEHHH